MDGPARPPQALHGLVLDILFVFGLIALIAAIALVGKAVERL